MTITTRDVEVDAIQAEASAVADVLHIGRTQVGHVRVDVPTAAQARAVAERLNMHVDSDRDNAHVYGCAWAMRDLTQPDKPETVVLVVVVAAGS